MRELIGTALRGLRARGLLSAGSILLTALAVGSAVLAPVFSSAVVTSYGITRLAEPSPMLTGLTFTLQPTGRPGADSGGDPGAVRDRAVEDVAARTGSEFDRPRAFLEAEGLAVLGGQGRLLSAEGACESLVVEGECPQSTGDGAPQVLLARTDLKQNGLAIGDTLTLGRAKQPRSLGRAEIVGSYRAPDGAEGADYWFDLSRLASIPASTNPISGEAIPYRPAPLIVHPDVFDDLPAGSWHVRLDSTLAVAADWTRDDRERAAETAGRLADVTTTTSDGRLVGDSINQLPAIEQEVRDQEDAARASITPAVLSVVLVALALLLRLLLAAADARRRELALAGLRGVSGRRLWLLGLAEPVLLLALAAPLGALVGVGTGLVLVRSWLVPGLPMPIPWTSIVAGSAVLLVAAAIMVLSVWLVVRETLSEQLSGERRPQRAGRVGLVAQLVLVALAGVVLVSELGQDGRGEADLTDLFLPILLALSAGLLASRATAAAARWWARQRAHHGSLSGFVASRALSRRTEGVLVVLPLTAAIAIGVFAAGVHDSAAGWRHSVAATQAPADVVWDSSLALDDTMALTHEVDPEGEHLMAIGAGTYPDTNVVYVDGPRLPRIAEWPELWTPEHSVEDVASGLSPPEELPEFSGTELALTVDRDAEVDGELWVELRVDVGHAVLHREHFGPFADGEQTRSLELPYCAEGCRLRSLSVAGPAGLPTSMQGEVSLTGLTADGKPVADPWHGWSSGIQGDGALDGLDQGPDGLDLRVDTGADSGTVWLNAGGVPARVPMVTGQDSDSLVEETDTGANVPVNHAEFAAEPLHESESTPFHGPVGLLVDYTAVTAGRDLPEENMEVRVLADSDTPEAMQDALSERGLSVATTLESEQSVLDNSAYALALRLYAVVAVLVLLMALAGLVVSTAVQMPSRRRDAASLRVVGVPRRTVMRAVALEFGVVLGGAALAGGAAGALAQYVVLRTLTLGVVEAQATPRLIAAVDPERLVLLAVAAAVVLGAVAIGTAFAAVRGAHGGTLRENGR